MKYYVLTGRPRRGSTAASFAHLSCSFSFSRPGLASHTSHRVRQNCAEKARERRSRLLCNKLSPCPRTARQFYNPSSRRSHPLVGGYQYVQLCNKREARSLTNDGKRCIERQAEDDRSTGCQASSPGPKFLGRDLADERPAKITD